MGVKQQFTWATAKSCACRLPRGCVSAIRPQTRWFVIGCDSPPKIHLALVTAEPNAAAYRVQTKFPWAIPDFEIVGSLLDTAVPEGYLLGILQI
jgi:hypothetical protein